jgi:hypothetical protein
MPEPMNYQVIVDGHVVHNLENGAAMPGELPPATREAFAVAQKTAVVLDAECQIYVVAGGKVLHPYYVEFGGPK